MKRDSSYSEKLKDPRWQKRRLKVLEYANWRCQLCGAKDKPLHCHHSYYARGKAPWQYPDGSIICVCEPCHGKLHPKKAVPVPAPIPHQPPFDTAEAAADHARAVESGQSRFAKMRALLDELP